MAEVESTVTIKLLDNDQVEIGLEQKPHLYGEETLVVAMLALDDLLNNHNPPSLNRLVDKATWWVDWPKL